MSKVRLSAWVLAFTLTVPAVAISDSVWAAKPEGKGNDKGKDKSWKGQKSDSEGAVEAPRAMPEALTASQQDQLAELILEKEYGFTKNSVPAGSAKRLPPGLQKKLARGGSLPPGWQKKLSRGEVIEKETYEQAEKLPDELLRRITGREDAVELLRVGDRILRVMEGRGTILDVVDLTDRAVRMLE